MVLKIIRITYQQCQHAQYIHNNLSQATANNMTS